MNGKLYYKKQIENLINFNPTEIEIMRVSKTDDGYGGATETNVLITETVAFYEKKAKREVISSYGESYTGVSVTKVLTKSNADILHNDTFTANGLQYRVSFIKDYFDICKQIEVEVIK